MPHSSLDCSESACTSTSVSTCMSQHLCICSYHHRNNYHIYPDFLLRNLTHSWFWSLDSLLYITFIRIVPWLATFDTCDVLPFVITILFFTCACECYVMHQWTYSPYYCTCSSILPGCMNHLLVFGYGSIFCSMSFSICSTNSTYFCLSTL